MTRTALISVRDRLKLQPAKQFVFRQFVKLAIAFNIATEDAWFFKANSHRANQAAAVRRINHLLSGRAVEEYDFQNEPYVCGY